MALPEVFAWRGPQDREPASRRAALRTTPALLPSELARRLGIWLVAGSILENADGEAAGRKCLQHRCAVRARRHRSRPVPQDPSLRRRRRRPHRRFGNRRRARPADAPCCVDTELGRIGLAVCYDLRFPELFRGLADAGAEIVVMPSAFTRADRPGPLAHARARPRDREPVLLHRAEPVRRVGDGLRQLRPLLDRRSMGRGHGRRGRRTGPAWSTAELARRLLDASSQRSCRRSVIAA